MPHTQTVRSSDSPDYIVTASMRVRRADRRRAIAALVEAVRANRPTVNYRVSRSACDNGDDEATGT